MDGYRLGLYEKAMPNNLTLKKKLRGAKVAGFDFLEISIDETDDKLARLFWTMEERAALRQAMAEEGLSIDTMCLSGHRKYPLGSRDEKIRTRGMEIFCRAVDLARDTGIRLIQLAGYDVYYEDGGEDTRGLFLHNLREGVAYAATQGVILGFETMETPFMDTISKAMAIVHAVDSPYLGVYPDLGNLTNACRIYGSKVADELKSGRGRMFAMHIKETEEGKYRDMRFGAGKVDFIPGIAGARELGVGLFVAECWHDGGEDWLDRIRKVNAFVRGRFGDRTARKESA